MLERATRRKNRNQQGKQGGEVRVIIPPTSPSCQAPVFSCAKGWPLLFVDANKMVSAPFPRSHENGLPGNHHLREATKMTMLWMSAKWCWIKKTTATATARQRFFFSCFLFTFTFIFDLYLQSKRKQNKANKSKSKAKLSSAFICFTLVSACCTRWNYCVSGVLSEMKHLISWLSLTFKRQNRAKLSTSRMLNITILLRWKCYGIITQT